MESSYMIVKQVKKERGGATLCLVYFHFMLEMWG
jgi:hypothetical protein